MKLFAVFFAFVLSVTNLMAQPYTLQLQVSGQPEIPVILGQVKGDKFIPVDSSMVHLVTFSSPAQLKCLPENYSPAELSVSR